MASLQAYYASGLLFSSSSGTNHSRRTINAAISVNPKNPRRTGHLIILPRKPATNNYLVDQLHLRSDGLTATTTPIEKDVIITANTGYTATTAKLYAILEAVADRVEMHKNVGKQRNDWNSLLLNSINIITLTASTMAGVAAAGETGAAAPLFSLKLSSALLFSAATGMLLVMNKIQPSQLAEEQRNATRLFKKLHNQIQTTLALHVPTESHVEHAMEKVLALDRAYPLPLLGKMVEKFPKKFAPAAWWPKISRNDNQRKNKNGSNWNQELDEEMREVLEVIKRKDSADYMRLGNIALKVNKILAISGPLLTGIAAAGSVLIGKGSSWPAMVAVVAGALASTVNTMEHGGQVGMVVEMYRNCAGFFTFLEESIESRLEESDEDKREDGELFEMEIALELGRNSSQLRDLAITSSANSCIDEATIDDFASKLF